MKPIEVLLMIMFYRIIEIIVNAIITGEWKGNEDDKY